MARDLTIARNGKNEKNGTAGKKGNDGKTRRSLRGAVRDVREGGRYGFS